MNPGNSPVTERRKKERDHTPTPKTNCKYCSCDLLDHNFDESDKCHDIGTKYKTPKHHTPAPWVCYLSTIYKPEKDDLDSCLDAIDRGNIVCSVINQEDAAFIVRAVNAHEELLAELISAHASEIQFRNKISMAQHKKDWPKGCSTCEAIAKASAEWK